MQSSLDHLNPALVVHLRPHLNIYPIRHLFWSSVSCNNQSFTVQMSSPCKCSQKSGYSVFNVVAAVFSQIFCAFLPSFLIHRTHPPLLSFLQGFSSCWDIDLRYASRIQEDFPSWTFLLVLLTYRALGWAFTIYWQSPQMFYCPWIGP